MIEPVGRRKVLKGLAATGLLALSAPFAFGREDRSTGFKIEAPQQVLRNRPFVVRIKLFSPVQQPDSLHWVEIFLGRELVGRWEFSQRTPQAHLEVWLVAERSAVLKVRDYFGRTVKKRLRVVG